MLQLTTYVHPDASEKWTHPVRAVRENGSVKKRTSGQILAENLTRLMAESLDLRSNLALAKRAKVGHTHIGRILRLESSPTLEFVDAIATAFGVDTWELLTDGEEVRRLVLERALGRPPVPDSKVEQHYPPAPSKVVAMRRRKRL
jgi:transcriptional regulator with XRE-family HTH domain